MTLRGLGPLSLLPGSSSRPSLQAPGGRQAPLSLASMGHRGGVEQGAGVPLGYTGTWADGVRRRVVGTEMPRRG